MVKLVASTYSNRIRLLFLSVLAAATVACFEARGDFVNEPPPEEVRQIEECVAGASVEEIQKHLLEEKDIRKQIKIIQALGRKANPVVLALKKFVDQHTEDLIENRRLRAVALVAIARAETQGKQTDYVRALGQLLTPPCPREIAEAAVGELMQVGTKEAREVLFQNENGNSPIVKMGRLRLDYGKMNDAEFVGAILASAMQTIRGHKGEDTPLLVAERSVLAGRGSAAIPLMKKAIEDSDSQADDISRKYTMFLKQLLADLERAEKSRRPAQNEPATSGK